MKFRLVHTQASKGPILINDIDQGLPIEYLDEQRKQDCYVTYNHKYFAGLEVVTDTSLKGFIDLVPSDKVKLSAHGGVIAGLVKAGLIDVIEIPTGALKAPVVASVTQDTADTYDVTIAGSRFDSFDPYVTKVTLTDGATVVELTSAQIVNGGGTFSSTEIVILAATHGFATDASENITSATVTTESGTSTKAV